MTFFAFLSHNNLISKYYPFFSYFQAKQFHENMEQLRSEASKLINDANERGKKSAAELERYW